MVSEQTKAPGSWLPNLLKGERNSRDLARPEDAEMLQDESTALLSKPDSTEDEDSRLHPILFEFWILVKGSVPVILAYALQNSLQTFSVLIVGRLSPEALSVAAFCYMFAMATVRFLPYIEQNTKANHRFDTRLG